jgi:hypothetical protein
MAGQFLHACAVDSPPAAVAHGRGLFDHDVGCLDDGPSFIPGLKIEISDGFVRDCGCNDDPIANVDPDMGRRSTFLDFDDLALELITRAQL